MGHFLLQMVEQAALDPARRDRHALQRRKRAGAGDEIEDFRDVAPDRRLVGEGRQIGVDARGDRVIIAGADVAIGDDLARFLARDHRQLGVGLELREAEHDLHAGALQRARPADIGLLVETGLQLDQRGHGLAGLGRGDQRRDDRAVGRGAVERLLDREHARIARRLLQQLQHDVEGLVGVVDDEILAADRGEAIAVELAHAFGIARREGRELELGALGPDDLGQRRDRELLLARQGRHARRASAPWR